MEKIWIDAAEFTEKGGFVLETQFVREMGQAYLMADGVGEPVAPAAVSFNATEGGMHRVFIRTKNWCCEHDPDGIVVEIDGVKSEHVCSEVNVRDWYFEAAGDFMLSEGEHTLKVYDTKGWFGRFAAVVITNDYDFFPSREMRVFEKQRAEIKGIENTVNSMGHYDMIIVGAGVGGIVTAIASARHGLKTALINDRPRLGGNSAEEANVALEGASKRGCHESGISIEMKNYRHDKDISWSDAYDYFTEKEPLLDVFSNMLVNDARTENGKITDISAISVLDLSKYTFSADLFVDATGDGWLGYYAGAAYRIGREAKFQHGESFAPENADSCTMSGCATRKYWNHETACSYIADETDAPVEFKAPSWAFKLPEGDELGRRPRFINIGEWWLEMPNDYDDLFENEFVRDSMFRMSVGYFDWLKNSWTDREKSANYKLRALGTYNAKRESRRLIGDTLLTEQHFRDRATFDDAVCYCGWCIDVHHVNGIFSGRGGMFTLNDIIPVSQIPFSSLYSKNVDNLMMCGRCVSVTHIALGTVRVQLTAAVMGQAIAAAAELCKRYRKTPREIRHENIDELQQMILKDDCYIPGVYNHDKADMALSATATASSCKEGYTAANAINGKTRIIDGEDYAWISDVGLPQSITLSFDAPKKIRQVRLLLEIPLEKYTKGFTEIPTAEGLAKDFTVSVKTKDGWKEVGDVKDNIMRLCIFDFEPVEAEAVKVTVNRSLEADHAMIPEIRIY